MKLRLAAFLLAAASFAGLSAAKPTVYIQKFDNSANAKDGWVAIVRGAVIEGFHDTNRTEIVDAITEEQRYEEEIRRLKDNLATDNLETTEALKTLGSHALVSADVSSISIPGKRLDSGTMSYDATVTYTVRIVNALDGSTIATKTFTVPGPWDMSTIATVFETEDAALQGIKGKISKAMHHFVEDAFPLSGPIEDVEKVSKNGKAVETLYVGLGSADGLRVKTKLDVKCEQKIGKRTALRTIGEVEVVEVVGDDIALCKVKSFGDKIKEALDQEQTLVVETKQHKK